MLVAGFMGEAGYINSMVGFVIGMLGWFYILYEIFAGDAGKQAGQASLPSSAFGNMRLVVTIGWAIYPLGYVLGYFVMVDASGATTAAANQTLNVVYNLADIVNKLAFCLLVWYTTTSDNKSKSCFSLKVGETGSFIDPVFNAFIRRECIESGLIIRTKDGLIVRKSDEYVRF